LYGENLAAVYHILAGDPSSIDEEVLGLFAQAYSKCCVFVLIVTLVNSSVGVIIRVFTRKLATVFGVNLRKIKKKVVINLRFCIIHFVGRQQAFQH
jgi:hypothetical protein